MPDTLLTTAGVLQGRLAAARAREKAARAEQARLKRELAAADRRMETQRLCTLGRAWLALGERSGSFRESGARFLAGYIVRDTDRAALAGSAWAVPDPDPVGVTDVPATEGGDHAG